MSRIYTLVVYRPNGEDTCRGSVMSRSDSDFEMISTTFVTDVWKLWGNKMYENDKSDRGTCSWQVTLLINGHVMYSDEGISGDTYEPDEPEDLDAQVQADNIHTQATQHLQSLHKRDKDAAAEKAEAQAREAFQRKAAAALEKEARDLSEYVRLKNKFENITPADCNNCHKCLSQKPSIVMPGLNATNDRMIVCPTCGNKRCPKASDHTLSCTNSNSPGQHGSVY